MILHLFFIAFCCTYIIGYADFPRNFLSRIYSNIFHWNVNPQSIKLLKIFECPLCATTWISLFYLLCTNPLSLYFVLKAIFLSLLAGYSTKYINYTLTLIDAIISKILILLERTIDKI